MLKGIEIRYPGYLQEEYKSPHAFFVYEDKAYTVDDLEREVIDNGFGWVLEVQHPQFTRLSQIATNLTGHPKNRSFYEDPKKLNLGEVAYQIARYYIEDLPEVDICRLDTCDILAILLYTGTDVQGKFRMNMILKQPWELPQWPILYDRLYRAYSHLTKMHSGYSNHFKGTTYHGLSGIAIQDLDQLVSRQGDWWQAGFVLPTFFSTSRDSQVAINFAAGEGGTTDSTDNNGMVIEFKCHGIGVDVSWISKFKDEQEILLPPYVIAAPDFSQSYEYWNEIAKGNDPNKIGRIKGIHHSVYSSHEDALRAIQN